MIFAEAECPTRVQKMLNSSPKLRRRFCRSVALSEDGKEPVNHLKILSDLAGGVMVSRLSERSRRGMKGSEPSEAQITVE
jgi:hypothetical protein